METPLEKILAKSYKQEMMAYIASHPNAFEELIELAIANKQPYSWRAAWLLWSCMENNDKRIKKHIPTILENLDVFKDGHQRNLINILQKMQIPEEHEGRLFDSCVNIWVDTDKQSSVRFKAFECIVEITKRYPELYNEVATLTEERYLAPLSQGIKRSIFKKIKILDQMNTLDNNG